MILRKFICLFCLLAVVLSAYTTPRSLTKCAPAVNETQDPIAKFWKWFVANEKRLKQFETDPAKYLNEILTEAKKIKQGLAIECEPAQQGIINMTISADGDRNLFPAVSAIVAKAPKIEGWSFFAFRQRLKGEQLNDLKLKVKNYELSPHKMKFFPIASGDTLDIIVYIKGINDENYMDLAYGGLLLLDNILGEYDCVTKVRNYDFHEFPTRQEELIDLAPLLELPAFVDSFHASRKK